MKSECCFYVKLIPGCIFECSDVIYYVGKCSKECTAADFAFRTLTHHTQWINFRTDVDILDIDYYLLKNTHINGCYPIYKIN